MKSEIEVLANNWYKEWLKTHDPFEDDFEDKLYKALPFHKFTYDI